MARKNKQQHPLWLLFFYRVPSKPVNSRMRIWRKLAKAGAIQMKGAVYILPFSDEHYEFLQWLVSEIVGMKGESAFVSVEKIDTMKDSEIVAFFSEQRADEYKTIGKALDAIERRLNSIQKGSRAQDMKGMTEQLARILIDFEEVKRIDFFSAEEGTLLDKRIHHLQTDLKVLSGSEPGSERNAAIPLKNVDDFRGKVWMTRKKPFIDRMASAWLIRRFIDRDAVFDFVDEKDLGNNEKQAIAFDMQAAEFTHKGDLCTFEVMVKSFGLKDGVLRKIAKIVHDLDMKDNKYETAEAKGLEDILEGIRKTAKNDHDILEKGIAIFEMLYAARS